MKHIFNIFCILFLMCMGCWEWVCLRAEKRPHRNFFLLINNLKIILNVMCAFVYGVFMWNVYGVCLIQIQYNIYGGRACRYLSIRYIVTYGLRIIINIDKIHKLKFLFYTGVFLLFFFLVLHKLIIMEYGQWHNNTRSTKERYLFFVCEYKGRSDFFEFSKVGYPNLWIWSKV